MADSPPYPGAPRWVKVLGAITLIVIVLLAVRMLTGGPGAHGPHRHRTATTEQP